MGVEPAIVGTTLGGIVAVIGGWVGKVIERKKDDTDRSSAEVGIAREVNAMVHHELTRLRDDLDQMRADLDTERDRTARLEASDHDCRRRLSFVLAIVDEQGYAVPDDIRDGL